MNYEELMLFSEAVASLGIPDWAFVAVPFALYAVVGYAFDKLKEGENA